MPTQSRIQFAQHAGLQVAGVDAVAERGDAGEQLALALDRLGERAGSPPRERMRAGASRRSARSRVVVLASRKSTRQSTPRALQRRDVLGQRGQRSRCARRR